MLVIPPTISERKVSRANSGVYCLAEKNGITILRHYIDRAFSAKTDNRPEFQNMIKDSGKRLFDMIIVWKLDRFARNRYDSARYKAALKRTGSKWCPPLRSFPTGPRASFWKACWRVMPNTTPPTCPKRLSGHDGERLEMQI